MCIGLETAAFNEVKYGYFVTETPWQAFLSKLRTKTVEFEVDLKRKVLLAEFAGAIVATALNPGLILPPSPLGCGLVLFAM